MNVICVAYPTIMSGLVLRWYADEQAFREHRQLANAGRECFVTFEGCPEEVRKLADSAHSYLTVRYAGHHYPRLDVSRWVTHRQTSIFSRELEAVAGPDSETGG